MTGTIKTISDRGFLFILVDDGSDDLYCHARDVVDNRFDTLRVGARLDFEVGASPRDGRRRAFNAVVI